MTTNLAKLVPEIQKLEKMPAIKRAERARELSKLLRWAAGIDGDAAVHEATRGHYTYAEAAEALGWATVTVDRAIQRHRNPPPPPKGTTWPPR